jgi:predicted O-methyltransferase YrrM
VLEALVVRRTWATWGGRQGESAAEAAAAPESAAEPEAADAYELFEAADANDFETADRRVGSVRTSAKPVAVVSERCPIEATILVSDETAEDGVRVRRMRFFQAATACTSDPTGVPRDFEHGEADGLLVSSIIQTEMLLRDDGTVDCMCLRSGWHTLMVAALALASGDSLDRVLVLGHGGGALSSFLQQALGCEVTAIDFSAAVASLARAHFADSGTRVHVCDAEWYVKDAASSQIWDAIFVDLSASHEDALAAPPACMYTAETVHALASCAPVVITNALAANRSHTGDWRRVRDAFRSHFAHVRWLRSSACDNRVLVAARTRTPSSLHAALDSWLSQQPR